MKKFLKLFKTKTVVGAVVSAVGYLSDPAVLAVLPVKVAAVVTAVGAVLTAVGLRDALDKAKPEG